MKFVIPRQDLLEAVNKVKAVVSPKSALPILSHILVEATGPTIKLAATDLKVSIECSVDCTVNSEGAITLPCARLANILSALPDSDVTVELEGENKVNIQCGRSKTKLYSMSPEDFPPIRSFEGVEPLVLDQSLVKDLFSRTSFAICTDQARGNLTGLMFELAGGCLTVVATDGRRMSLCRQREGVPAGIDLKVIIPGKMINELERLLTGEDEVQVLIDETQAAFVFGSVRLVSALVEGSFPNYEMVIPKKHDKEIVCNTGAFGEALRRARTVTNDKFNSVRVSLTSGQMQLAVVTPEVGEHQEELPVEYDGDAVEIAFNPDFVLDVVRHMNSDKMVLMLKDATSPGLLKPYTEAPEDNYLNVVMPIRL